MTTSDPVSEPGSGGRPAHPERPLGVTIIAILAAIGGVLGLLASLAILGVLGAVGGLGTLFVLLALVVSIVSLVFAYGAWTLQPWAWTLGIVLEVLAVINGLYAVARGDASAIISIAIAGVILWYLFQPDVKRAFGRT